MVEFRVESDGVARDGTHSNLAFEHYKRSHAFVGEVYHRRYDFVYGFAFFHTPGEGSAA